MDTATGDRDVWKQLGQIAYRRRQELGLTQEALAKRFEVSLGTIQRLEDGKKQNRRGPTWPKLEAGYGWGPGFIENFTSGLVSEEPRTEEGGRFVRTPAPGGDIYVKDMVRKIIGRYAPDTPYGEVERVEAEMIEYARGRGLIPQDAEEGEV